MINDFGFITLVLFGLASLYAIYAALCRRDRCFSTSLERG